MCAIVGAIVRAGLMGIELHEAQQIMSDIWHKSHARGRDGRGFLEIIETGHNDGQNVCDADKSIISSETHTDMIAVRPRMNMYQDQRRVVIGNLRAEPTTEYVAEKKRSDQQPYLVNNWAIVHNGTIANDKELRNDEGDDSYYYAQDVATRIDSAAVPEVLASLERMEPDEALIDYWTGMLKVVKGSYALLGAHRTQPGTIFYAVNYRPLWYIRTQFGVFFASSREFFPHKYVHCAQMIEPYTYGTFHMNARDEIVHQRDSLRTLLADGTRANAGVRSLVVCSGGLDSTVAATARLRAGDDVTLLHFHYGSRAEDNERNAITAIAKRLGVRVVFKQLPNVWDIEDSNLLNKDSAIAGGEDGAEFAHEWVPARNTVMLAIATAYAEAKGYDYIVLGNNLEEAGAYPDNEPEFIARFNDLLPFAVGDGKRVRIDMPVGNLMKHEIVKLGLELDAPLDLTWSCYRKGKHHCGKCGPCFMRRTAFEINKAEEVITYKE